MNNNQILLSICIPTYNRGAILNGNLNSLFKQIRGKDLPIEIIVSDNCSSDDTFFVVQKYIEDGMVINYLRNDVNLGMDGNFAQCYRKANGKYILVLGDDDYLIEGKLEKLLNYLSKGDYGIVHLKIKSNTDVEEEFYNAEIFLGVISFWITYITSNIINSSYIPKYDFEKYFGTYLTIMPLYLTAAINHEKNIILNERIFADGLVSKTNGGYNYFEVFVVNYLSIWNMFVSNKLLSKELYKFVKRDILKKFLIPNVYYLLIEKTTSNYKLERSWRNLLNNYAFCPYFYFYLISFIMRRFASKILHKD